MFNNTNFTALKNVQGQTSQQTDIVVRPGDRLKIVTENATRYLICGLSEIVLHRDNDLPALEIDDRKEWYSWGQLHRENDQPAVIIGAYKEWRCLGLLHRTRGPAIIYSDGSMAWYKYDELSRTDGPAYIRKRYDGIDTYEYWVNGKRYSKFKFKLYKLLGVFNDL